MARARNIKPKFFQNDELGELDPLARLLFIGLWTIADFKGCLEYRVKRIKAQILPYDECNIEELSISLDKSGFISIYSVRGQLYIKILKFERHQTPHKNERDAGSEVPDITENDILINELKEVRINPDKNGTTRAESLFPLPSSLNLNPVSLNPIPEGSDAKPASVPRASTKKKVETESAETWESYCNAYFLRYGVEPVRNATVNSQISNFVRRLGIQDAPHVAAFYVGHSKAWYVQQSHQVGPMLADCEGLRTQWATNTKMTHTKAVQADRTQTNLDAFAPLIAAAEARERENGK